MTTNDFNNWASTYDLIYGNYKEDISFYVDSARAAVGKVLEVACGTGRIYLELLKAGVEAYGIDIADKELEVLRSKAAALNLEPKVKMADMRNFRLQDEFKLIIIPFRAFLHNITPVDQLRTLKACRRHLAPGGKLALNFFYPDPRKIAGNYGKNIHEAVESSGGNLERVTKSHFADETEQIVEINDSLKRAGKTIWRDTFTLAFIYKREFDLLLKSAGFTRWQVYGGFDYQPLTSNKQEMVWVIER